MIPLPFYITFLYPEAVFGVFGGCGGDGFWGETAQLCNFFCDVRDKARVAAAAAEGLRGHVGAVGLDENAVERDVCGAPRPCARF